MPKMLSEDAFAQAVRFVHEHGRPLDRALLDHLFFDVPADIVIRALETHQNQDGGFFGLEPDIRTKTSSPIVASMALTYLRDAGAAPETPIVQRLMAYLRSSLDPAQLEWSTIGPEVNDAPHAPWWQYDPAMKRTQAGSPANPTAALTAGLLRFATDSADRALTDRLVSRLIDYLGSQTELEQHDLQCFLELYPALPAPIAQQVGDKLRSAALSTVTRNPEQWANYGLQPLAIAPSATSWLTESLRDELNENLDWTIAQQRADGSWAPTWSWFGTYDDAWPEAEREWKAVLTVKTLRMLADHGRVLR